MRILYEPERQAKMRLAWIDVIFLNIILAAKLMLDKSKIIVEEKRRGYLSISELSVKSYKIKSQRSTNTAKAITNEDPSQCVDSILYTRLKLAPFLSVESSLRKRLGAITQEPSQNVTLRRASSSYSHTFSRRIASSSEHPIILKSGWEQISHSSSCHSHDANEAVTWTKSSTDTVTQEHLKRSTLGHSMSQQLSETQYERSNDPARLLRACANDIHEMWKSLQIAMHADAQLDVGVTAA